MNERDEERVRELTGWTDEAPTIPIDDFRKRSRRSFLTGAVGVTGAIVGWRWLGSQPPEGRIPGPLRAGLEANEAIWKAVSDGRSAPEYPISRATPIQVNGLIGLRNEIDVDRWTLRVEGPDGAVLDELDLSFFESLPQRDLVIEHKCIEGWSSIVHWGGARFSDFHERFADRVGDAPYVSLETVDGQYYVGWDTSAILHPQTMLVLREGDRPLDSNHGAPLRLATPNRYGIKCIKRIGLIRYTHERPRDYWAERGYDWFAGL